MRLTKARVRKYRSIRDSELFDVESTKTILVGPNEAGKTALLEALQQLNAPKDVRGFDPLRDYPRSEYNDITTKKVLPKNVTVVEGHFALDSDDQEAVPEGFRNCTFVVGRRLDNRAWHRLDGGAEIPKYKDVQKDLLQLATHVGGRIRMAPDDKQPSVSLRDELAGVTSKWAEDTLIDKGKAGKIGDWLAIAYPWVDESNETEGRRHDRIKQAICVAERKAEALAVLYRRRPVLVLFSNYFRVKPRIHLSHLADRIENNTLDDEHYDHGNNCLLRLLGFSARELSDLGGTKEPNPGDTKALERYRSQLDNRTYQLNAASVKLTKEIRKVWMPDQKRAEADKLRVLADGQYLKVVVEDDLGVEIELDQRSEGFQWLVSFFVVFFAEAQNEYNNAILLLDEPGLSLHGLKQREFRETVSRLAETNQTLYTTHSPFLVGPEELDLVRVLEMNDREVGTKVHTRLTAQDTAALLPLQEALGYDLAQSLFTAKKNLILEGLTDYWYVQALADMLRAAGGAELNQHIALVPAGGAGKVVYFATILHAHRLKVAALLDSDAAGNQAAKQETLVHTLGHKQILRTIDLYDGVVEKPEIEELLRDTLVAVAKKDLGWDVSAAAAAYPSKPIVRVFESEITGFSKYKLAKAFLRWARDHEFEDLQKNERRQGEKLINAINTALR